MSGDGREPQPDAHDDHGEDKTLFERMGLLAGSVSNERLG